LKRRERWAARHKKGGVIYEYNLKFLVGDRIYKKQQSAFSFEDAKRRIMRVYPKAHNFVLLKKMGYPHDI
jgi:hypothetical protein